jgi:ABC-type sulfate transport system permease component
VRDVVRHAGIEVAATVPEVAYAVNFIDLPMMTRNVSETCRELTGNKVL